MINSWKKEDIEIIMLQLNNQNLPFKKCEFVALGEGMKRLGSGAFANVYEAVERRNKNKKYAVKVIGFGNKHIDSETFRKSILAQRCLGYYQHNIVKILDSVELRVWIEGDNNVIRVEIINPYRDSKPEGNYLHLQFVLMEKLLPILSSNRFHHKLQPFMLAVYDEKEILKMAYDIGMALDAAHKNNLIHRDIKLENIFYDEVGQKYKLGDFGIARTTDDGMVSTVAFTKGYGAPEVVGTLEDKYDCTADIYSFGMMLYVLLNEMKFPESTNYYPTVYQYQQGYVPPEPINGSDKFVKIVLKMLRFDPDDRYQSMEKVLNEFDELKFGYKLKYQREHRNTALVLGSVFAFIGTAVWKLSFKNDIWCDFGIWEYVFWTVSILMALFYIANKKSSVVNVMLMAMGIIGGCAITANVTYLLMKLNSVYVFQFAEYRWVAILLLSLAGVLFCLYFLLGIRDDKLIKFHFRRNRFIISMTAYYFGLIFVDYGLNCSQRVGFYLYEKLLGKHTIEWILSCDLHFIGFFGIVFLAVWMIREWFLAFIENQ